MHVGEGVINLVEWLKAASIDREAGLLKALSQVPMPKKVPVEGTQRCDFDSCVERITFSCC